MSPEEKSIEDFIDQDSIVDTPPASIASIIIRAVITLAILALAVGVAVYFIQNKPQSKKKETHESHVTSVEVIEAQSDNHPAIINVMGQIIPAMETTLKAQVSGEIIAAAPEFIPGGFFKAGEEILSIDPQNYELDLKMKKAALAQANAALSLEMGQQSIARDELEILQKSMGKKLESSDLTLRKPQLAQAHANIASAKAGVELAELNLSRTKLNAPFNALVRERNTNFGNNISAQETLATLVNTDEYWIEVSIPVYQMNWLILPNAQNAQGSPAKIMMDGGRGDRNGFLLKTTGALNAQSRLATLIIAVKDPLLLSAPSSHLSPLVLGDYVRVALEGKKLENVTRVPRGAVRDGQNIWVAKEGKLAIIPITVAFEDEAYSYITNSITAGDKIITSSIPVPIHGMEVKIIDDNNTPIIPAAKTAIEE